MAVPTVFRSSWVRPVAVVLGCLVALSVAVAIVYRDGREPVARPMDPDLAGRIGAAVAAHSPGQPYRDPTPAERAAAVPAFDQLPDDPSGLAALGLTAVDDVDAGTGRRYLLLASAPGDERAWGVVVVDRSRPVRFVIEVPHPGTDIDTEWVGLDLFRRVPGSLLLIAGANRNVDDDRADVAHNADSMFHAWHVQLARRGVPQVQLHGYADRNLPDADLVVSTGTGDDNRLAQRVADRLDREFTVCEAWRRRCGRLEGTTNVQADAASRYRSDFVHLEMSNSVRVDTARRADVVAAIAAAFDT